MDSPDYFEKIVHLETIWPHFNCRKKSLHVKQ